MNKIAHTFLILIASTFCVAAERSKDQLKAQGGTGYTINQIRTFDVDENTVYKEDGNIIPELNAQGGTGYKLRYKVIDVNPSLSNGLLEELDLINIYKGPLLSKSPFKVFNINGQTSSQTFVADNLSIDDLNEGDQVLVSGFIDINAASIITRIEKVDTLSEWKLSGVVSELNNQQFKINEQLVSFTPSQINSCNSSLNEGDFVEIKAMPTANFQIGDLLNTVTDIQCVERGVGLIDGAVLIEGMIDTILVDGDFSLAGQEVEVSQSTKYIRGRKQDVQQNVKVEVEGTVDQLSGVIIATKVRFIEPRVNLTVPVMPNEFNFESFTVAGITLKVTPQTLDPDGIISGGLSETTQIQLKGYGYSADELFITRVNQLGNVDFNDVSLNGFITSITQPHIELFGITIDTSSSQFKNQEGLNISSAEFFSLISINTQVSIESALYDHNSLTISSGIISIEELAEEAELHDGNPNTGDLYGIGTITLPPDEVFADSFELNLK